MSNEQPSALNPRPISYNTFQCPSESTRFEPRICAAGIHTDALNTFVAAAHCGYKFHYLTFHKILSSLHTERHQPTCCQTLFTVTRPTTHCPPRACCRQVSPLTTCTPKVWIPWHMAHSTHYNNFNRTSSFTSQETKYNASTLMVEEAVGMGAPPLMLRVAMVLSAAESVGPVISATN